jgi:hypothetical protein
MIELPKEYSQIEDDEFPLVIGGIEYKSKQELAERYDADLMAFAQLLYDIWEEDSLSDSV